MESVRLFVGIKPWKIDTEGSIRSVRLTFPSLALANIRVRFSLKLSAHRKVVAPDIYFTAETTRGLVKEGRGEGRGKSTTTYGMFHKKRKPRAELPANPTRLSPVQMPERISSNPSLASRIHPVGFWLVESRPPRREEIRDLSPPRTDILDPDIYIYIYACVCIYLGLGQIYK